MLIVFAWGGRRWEGKGGEGRESGKHVLAAVMGWDVICSLVGGAGWVED